MAETVPGIDAETEVLYCGRTAQVYHIDAACRVLARQCTRDGMPLRRRLRNVPERVRPCRTCVLDDPPQSTTGPYSELYHVLREADPDAIGGEAHDG